MFRYSSDDSRGVYIKQADIKHSYLFLLHINSSKIISRRS